MGFEPTVPFDTAVFKTAAFDHSATPPGGQSSIMMPFRDWQGGNGSWWQKPPLRMGIGYGGRKLRTCSTGGRLGGAAGACAQDTVEDYLLGIMWMDCPQQLHSGKGAQLTRISWKGRPFVASARLALSKVALAGCFGGSQGGNRGNSSGPIVPPVTEHRRRDIRNRPHGRAR